MEIYGNGYSACQYDRDARRRTATKIATYLPDVMAHTGADSVVVTGKSGISMAFAALMLIDFPILTVRKDGESSHGSQIEGTTNHEFRKYLILDDLVDTGETVRRVVNTLTNHSTRWGENQDNKLQCVGVVCYQGYNGPNWLKDYEEYQKNVHITRDGTNIPIYVL